ncbi:MAG: hypothetical protein M3Y18_02915 [Candidatus Eremiobacteraeota bacterium]|nr:hypothetical protein [Candidatus Eremiobacteraeota bacterium]
MSEWIVPTPSPPPELPKSISRIDISAIEAQRAIARQMQIVLLAAKLGNGQPSRAPHLYRVEVTPAHIREKETLHVRAFATPDTDGVYLRIAIWTIGIPPVRRGHFPANDRDYPGRMYEEFEREYRMPSIPAILTGRRYQVEIIATGRRGLASGAFVPISLERAR